MFNHRYQIEPKYTYAQANDHVYFPKYTDYGGNANNLNIFLKSAWQNDTETVNPLMVPNPKLPQLGTNGHDKRHGDRITVTSIRTKIITRLTPHFVGPISNPWLSSYSIDPSDNYINRFFKCRYMVVAFDDDLQMTKEMIGQWFYETFCWYCKPITTPVDTNAFMQPVSVHSNILRITTKWTGKFNILTDKTFTLTSSRPSISFDITLPLNQDFLFEENTETLIHPHIYQFIVPPLSWAVDVDPVTYEQYKVQNPSDSISVISFYSFSKLNFIDL